MLIKVTTDDESKEKKQIKWPSRKERLDTTDIEKFERRGD